MPLHLLSKKSWNVYNKDNIERVKRDEEKARLDEQREERRGHDDEAADRLELLRHGQSDSAVVPERSKIKRSREDGAQHDARPAKYLRRHEDDEDTFRRSHDRRQGPPKSDDPLDNITNMRLRDAGGRSKEQPWYSSRDSSSKTDAVGKDVWGNEDTGRHSRDQHRLVSNDPLLAMKRGVRQLKDSEKQKAEWRKERERDLNEVEELARLHRDHARERRNRHRSRSRDRDRDCHRSSSHRHRHRSRSKSPRR